MNDFEISALVTKGYLTDEARSDPKAIKAAIEALISDLALAWSNKRSGGADLLRTSDFTENRKLAGNASHSLHRSRNPHKA